MILKPEQIQRELCTRSLAKFLKYAWPTIEPGTELIWNWHIDAICEHLEAVTRGEIKNLVINIPPGHMKSVIVSVAWPAWEWISRPEAKGLFASYAMDLALRDAVRSRDLILSPWYQELFTPEWTMSVAQDVKSNYVNTLKGSRFSTAVGARTTGFRGDKIIIDDPLSAGDALSQLERERAVYWLSKVISSRLNDPRTGAKVMIMQRLHDEDPTAYALEAWEDVQHLRLPSEFEPESRSRTSIGWADPRETYGELLFPQFFTAEVIEVAKRELGVDFAGQHQQRPQPLSGSIFQRHWWGYWAPMHTALKPVEVKSDGGEFIACPLTILPEEFDFIAQSWDFTFKDTKKSDFVSGGVWAAKGANRYLLDRVNRRMSFTESVDAIREMTKKWPSCNAVYVEDKANGPAIIDTLKADIVGIVPVDVGAKSKEARAHAVTPQIRGGQVFLPHPSIAPWVEEYVAQHTAFPRGAHDDDVDMTTQALNEMRGWADPSPVFDPTEPNEAYGYTPDEILSSGYKPLI